MSKNNLEGIKITILSIIEEIKGMKVSEEDSLLELLDSIEFLELYEVLYSNFGMDRDKIEGPLLDNIDNLRSLAEFVQMNLKKS